MNDVIRLIYDECGSVVLCAYPNVDVPLSHTYYELPYIPAVLYVYTCRNNVVAIVMGARRDEYARVAPPNSFIHVEDFPSAPDLAKYLLKLDRNDHLYNTYFRWKNTGEFVPTKFWCRLCSMLHDVGHDGKITWYEDIDRWWRNTGGCSQDRWDNPDDLILDWEEVDMLQRNSFSAQINGIFSSLIMLVFLSFCLYCFKELFCILWKQEL